MSVIFTFSFLKLGLIHLIASEGEKFARVSTEFTEEVRALGPLRLEPAMLAVHQPEGEEVLA